VNYFTHLQGIHRVGPEIRSAPVLWSGTVSGTYHQLSPVIRLGLRNQRKKEREEKSAEFKLLASLCYAAAQLELQLHRKRTQVECGNREARKRLGGRIELHFRNGPWTHECCFQVVYVYVGSGFRNCNHYDDYYYYYVLFCVSFFPPPPLFLVDFFWSSLNVYVFEMDVLWGRCSLLC